MTAGEAQAPTLGETLHATLRSREAVAIIVGIVVGAGIFRTPSIIAGASAGSADMLLCWLAGGLISVIGALCYAELASTYPYAGGDYHYLARAFGKRLAFLYAWARMSVIQTGSVALLAFVVGDYATQIFNLGPYSSAIYAAAVVVALTGINWIGVHAGTRMQNLLTVFEVLGLVAVVIAGLLLAPAVPAGPPVSETTNYGLIMVLVLLTFGGWNEAAYISAELQDAKKRMAPVLVFSLLLITALYVLVNMAYLRGLGLAGMAGSEAVAADLMRIAFGQAGAVLISLFIVIAALTSANATVFTGARTAFALGRDFPTLAFLGRWNDKTHTPGNALLAQGAVALALVVAAGVTRDGFSRMVDYLAPVFWFFFLLVGISLFVLRFKDRDIERPFKVPLYPVLPAIFCCTNAYLLYSSVTFNGKWTLVGVAIVVLGGLLLIPLGTPKREKIG